MLSLERPNFEISEYETKYECLVDEKVGTLEQGIAWRKDNDEYVGTFLDNKRHGLGKLSINSEIIAIFDICL